MAKKQSGPDVSARDLAQDGALQWYGPVQEGYHMSEYFPGVPWAQPMPRAELVQSLTRAYLGQDMHGVGIDLDGVTLIARGRRASKNRGRV